MSIVDLYKKENPLLSTAVEAGYGTSKKDPKNTYDEAIPEIASDVATSVAEKGISNETLTHVALESCRKLGLEDLNDAIENAENMDIVDSKAGDKSLFNKSVQLPSEKLMMERMLGWMLKHP